MDTCLKSVKSFFKCFCWEWGIITWTYVMWCAPLMSEGQLCSAIYPINYEVFKLCLSSMLIG